MGEEGLQFVSNAIKLRTRFKVIDEAKSYESQIKLGNDEIHWHNRGCNLLYCGIAGFDRFPAFWDLHPGKQPPSSSKDCILLERSDWVHAVAAQDLS